MYNGGKTYTLVQLGYDILLKVRTKNLIYEFDSVFEVLVKNSCSRPFQGAFFPDTLNTIKKELLKKKMVCKSDL